LNVEPEPRGEDDGTVASGWEGDWVGLQAGGDGGGVTQSRACFKLLYLTAKLRREKLGHISSERSGNTGGIA
jgi:hypothetical protein